MQYMNMHRINGKRLNFLASPPSLTVQFIMTFTVMLITFYSILCGSKMISIQWHSRHSFIVVHQASCETKGRKLATSVFGPLLPVRCSPICPLVAPDVAAPRTDFQMNEISSPLGRSTLIQTKHFSIQQRHLWLCPSNSLKTRYGPVKAINTTYYYYSDYCTLRHLCSYSYVVDILCNMF